MSAVDKFCLPYSKVFRSVAIGRMVGNFIEQYSETLVHFYPTDKRVLYRINKLMGKFTEGVDFDKLTAKINESLDREHQISVSEIAYLLAAQSTISTEIPIEEGEETVRIQDRFAAPPGAQPDVRVEQEEAMGALNEAVPKLSLWERKFLMLKGIAI